MLKTSTFMFLGAAFLAGCSSPQSSAKDAEDAQHEANEKRATAGEDNKLDADAIQHKADADKAKAANENASDSNAAQAEANRKSAEAAASLASARVAARDDSEHKLAELEKTFAELKPKLVKKLSKKDSTTLVDDLTARSEAVRKSIADLASATADSLEPIKSTVAQRLIDFDTALNDAKKRV